MDFEPFHSDDDEECASIMPEKKKKESKKSKGGPLFRNEKKTIYSDHHASPGLKGKHSVHGVVGPAEYTFNDQTSLPSGDAKPVSQVTNQPVQVSTVTNTPGKQTNKVSTLPPSVTIPPKSVAQHPHHQVGHLPKQNTLPEKHTPQQQQRQQQQMQQQQPVQSHVNTFARLNSSPASVTFTPNFPPMPATQPMKIDRDRPHVSPGAIPDAGAGPLPFKQSTQTPTQGKPTLLSQAMTVSQYHPHIGQQPPVQVTASNEMFARNQTFDSTVVAPSKPIPIPNLSNTAPGNVAGPDFHSNYEPVTDRANVPVHEYSEMQSGADRTHLQQPGSNSSHSASPFSNDVQPDNMWPERGVGQDFVDSAEWAHFNPSVSTNSPYDGDIQENRRKSHGTDSLSESIPESIGSSVESELEDSVWKINSEQKDYYTKQFMKIQPNISEVIKGPQARDFFLKSNLPNETLSMIWQLSDMDKDAALNLTEFCIAMHLVVAVKHGVELPTVLPFTLLSSLSEEHLVPMSEEVQPVIDESDVEEDDEIKNSSMSDEASSVDAPISSLTEQVRRSSMQELLQDRGRSESFGADGVPISPIADKMNGGGPMFNTPLKEVTSTQAAIARPRASAQKTVVNLMDSAPWQLLPPPSSKGKPQVKKTLNMDDESSFMSNDSFDQRNSFSSTEQLARSRHDFDNRRESLNDSEKSNGLSKEKSRSIDSLRQEMTDDYSHMEMRRISQGSRPRSYSGESPQFNGTSSKRISKEIEIPPLPPPRPEGHKRSASHDFNSVPNSSYPPGGTQVSSRHNAGVMEQKPLKQTIPSPQRVPPQSINTNDSSKQSVRFSDHLDVVDDGSLATSIDKKVRKHELQSRIRMLKDNNVTLSNLVARLHTEWKSASEERIALDVLLQKERQGLS